MSANIFQGRLLPERAFPSQAEDSIFFFAQSRCLVDLGREHLVVPVGKGLKPYQRGIFRLKLKSDDSRARFQFADDSCWSKEACVKFLQETLDAMTCCEIVGVNFPLFEQGELAVGKYIHRPCVSLYGNDEDSPHLYIAIFMGKPRDNDYATNYELLLTAPDKLQPGFAADSIVDCSKICTFPTYYNQPENVQYDDEFDFRNTFKPYKVKNDQTPTRRRVQLRATDTAVLRGQAIAKIIEMCRNNPFTGYTDSTIQYDIGKFCEGRYKNEDNEWVEYRTIYEGPPGYSAKSNPTVIIDADDSFERTEGEIFRN